MFTRQKEKLHKRGEHFCRRYGVAPEFRAGIQAGDMTAGVIKKNLAMRGDIMNIIASICSACTELNQKFMASKDFRDNTNLKEWQAEIPGVVALKGKNQDVELYPHQRYNLFVEL